jgi:hypothetical protein
VAAALGHGTTSWTRDGASAMSLVEGPVVALISGGNVETSAFTRYITAARHS